MSCTPDVNGDSKPDIVVVNWNNAHGSVAALLGNGDGTFQMPLSSDAPIDPGCLTIADVNLDGRPDLLICSEDTVAVLLGNGNGAFESFTNTNFFTGFCSSTAVVADVNGDGLPDMVVPNGGPDGCSSEGFAGILLGNGDGTFQPEVNYVAVHDIFLGIGGVAVRDVNGDGKADVMVTTGFDPHTNGSVAVLLGNGDGTFQAATSYDAGGTGTSPIVSGDLNRDGRPDIVVANFISGTLGVLLNKTPFCTAPPVVTLSITPTSLWPPNGKMVPVSVSGKVTDIETGCTIKTGAYAVKDKYRKVQPTGPVTLGPGGAYSFRVLLQASRLSTDLGGRFYTITVSVANNAGKKGSKAGTVIVPHDQGH